MTVYDPTTKARVERLQKELAATVLAVAELADMFGKVLAQVELLQDRIITLETNATQVKK